MDEQENVVATEDTVEEEVATTEEVETEEPENA